MNSKSHYCFGAYLLSEGYDSLSALERDAFLLGCVEPDWNPGTYLKGSLSGQGLRGHNFYNMMPFLKNLFWKLARERKPGVLFYYRLGKLTHYLTDAFTYPHNPTFSGTLKEHLRYESALEPLFLERLSSEKILLRTGKPADPFALFLREHRAYLNEKAGTQQDISFTVRVIPCIVYELSRRALSNSMISVNQAAECSQPLRI